MEDAVARHDGVLSTAVLKRASTGVVRKLYVSNAVANAALREQLTETLLTEPCPLLELDLRFARAEDDGGYVRAATAPRTSHC